MQEYNICFTTVQRPKDGGIPPLPEGAGPGGMAPLPTIIQGLVARRRQVRLCMGLDCLDFQCKKDLERSMSFQPALYFK